MSSSIRARISFTILLVVLAAALLLQPFVEVGGVSQFWLKLISFLVMLSALRQLGPARWVAAAAGMVVAVNVGLTAARIWTLAESWIAGEHATSVAFVLLVAGSITRNVWREHAVTSDTIVGGIAVYILIGVAFSGAYQLLELVVPGSFAIAFEAPGHWGSWEPTPGHYPRLLFFSFVTLTTLGYGDIVPASAPAAALCATAAVAGPLYLTILIARLVGLHIAGTRRAEDGGGAGESPRPR
jgi:hypothetical protein